MVVEELSPSQMGGSMDLVNEDDVETETETDEEIEVGTDGENEEGEWEWMSLEETWTWGHEKKHAVEEGAKATDCEGGLAVNLWGVRNNVSEGFRWAGMYLP